MKTFTKDQFIELVENGNWKRTQEICDPCGSSVEKFNEDTEEFYEITKYCGNAYMVSELDEIEIHYNEDYSYDEYMPESFQSSAIEHDLPWTLEGAVIVDEDGDKIGKFEESDFLDEICDVEFSDIDYSTIHEELEETVDIDETDETDETDDKDDDFISIEVDYAPNIRFKGECIARVETNDNNVHPDYSGKTGRWDDWSIWKTESGKFVCCRIEYTRWIGKTTSHYGKVCENEQEVIEFFGHCKLAKELYEKAGIEDVIEVE